MVDEGVAEGAGLQDLLHDLAALAASPGTQQATAEQIVALAQSTVGCEYAGLTLLQPGDSLETVAPTNPLVLEADLAQYALREGPCYSAATSQETQLSNDVETDPRWPRWGPRAAELGFTSLLAARMGTEEIPVGSLNLYSTRSKAFTMEDLSFAHLFAYHAGATLAQVAAVRSLREGLDGRTLIGQAQGVLMERFGLSADRAFSVLSRYSQDHNVKLREIAAYLVQERLLPPSGVAGSSRHLPPSSPPGEDDAREILVYRDELVTAFLTPGGLRIVGEIDVSNEQGWAALLQGAAGSIRGNRLHLDLSRLDFIGVSAMRILIRVAEELAPVELSVQVGPTGGALRRLATLCGAALIVSLVWEEEEEAHVPAE